MGARGSKPKFSGETDASVPAKHNESNEPVKNKDETPAGKKASFFPFYSLSPTQYLFGKKTAPATSGRNNPTPKRFFRKAFPQLAPARHIKAVLARRHGAKAEGDEAEEAGLNKHFGFARHFGHKYELGEEVGRGHFGYTCKAKFKKGEFKGRQVAVKIIKKSKMTTTIAIEDVRREVKILKTLTGHENLIRFYDAYEDHDRVYIVLELCEGGELLDRILSRGGKYKEDDAKNVLIQILSVVSFCHLQGVVHRDLKPEVRGLLVENSKMYFGATDLRLRPLHHFRT